MLVAKPFWATYDPGTMSERTIRAAAGQVTACLMNEADATLASLAAAIESAGRQQADLLVLPECAYPAYLLGSVESYRAGGHMSSEAFVDWLGRQAARHGLHIVCGFVEDAATALFNAAVLIDDRGQEVGRARKRFLWNADRDWFAPGTEIRALDSRVGRIGIAICAETRVPEILATLAADGAELVAMPTCWINGAREQGRFQNPQVDFLIEARAREFGVPFVCADKSGWEMPGVGYVGLSRIVAAGGELLAEAPPTGDAVVTARLTLRPARPAPVRQEHRRRLSSGEVPVRPAAVPPRKVGLAVVPTELFTQRAEMESWWEGLRRDTVRLVVTHLADEVMRERAATAGRRFGIDVVSASTGAGVSQVAVARVGCLIGREASSFAPARVLALDGAEMIVCFEPPEDLPLLRTRAMENRVFLVGVGLRLGVIVGPGGEVLAEADRECPGVVEIDLAAAGDKTVAPGTDVFTERRATWYRF